ncbi:hypothetical protein [Tsukamurella strandjordii]|uniref:hypothetical protein n=1 Tax=Tsukamurella strandjordii TaxID=147577 RepID=UPI0031D0D984
MLVAEITQRSTFKIGDRLPGLIELSERFGRYPRTPTTNARRAYGEVEDLGLVDRHPDGTVTVRASTLGPIDEGDLVGRRLDAIERSLLDALSEVRSLRTRVTANSSVRPKLGEWWDVRSHASGDVFHAVYVRDRKMAGEFLWLVAVDNTLIFRPLSHFDVVRRRDESPDWPGEGAAGGPSGGDGGEGVSRDLNRGEVGEEEWAAFTESHQFDEDEQ